jgi:hypothetical protein
VSNAYWKSHFPELRITIKRSSITEGSEHSAGCGHDFFIAASRDRNGSQGAESCHIGSVSPE